MQATVERLRSRREESKEDGFTLIELLIVIVILGILAAIVVFAVQNLTSSSAKASCQSDFKTVETAVEAYYAQVGHYPNTSADVNTGAGTSPVPAKGSDATTGAVAADPNAAAGTGVAALLSQQSGSNGGNVGPWLHDVPLNGNNYAIWVSNDGLGSIAVTPGTTAGNVSPTPFTTETTQLQTNAGCPS